MNQSLADRNPELEGISKTAGLTVYGKPQPPRTKGRQNPDAGLSSRLGRIEKALQIRNFANNEATNPLKGTPVTQLAQMYKEDNEKLRATLDALDTRYREKGENWQDLGYTNFADRQVTKKIENQAINDYVQAKTGYVPTAANLDKLANLIGLKTIKLTPSHPTAMAAEGEITHRTLKELIALDDWGSIAAVAIPLIEKYGSRGISWLWDKYVAKKPVKPFWEALGGDEGFIQTDQPQDPLKPYILARQPGVNFYKPGTEYTLACEDQYAADGANPDFLKSFFYPEKFNYRKSTKYPTKTALFGGVTEILATTADTTGNVAVYIFPQNLWGSNANGQLFAGQGAVIPSTGVLTTVASIAGPLTVPVANFEQTRLNAFSIQVIPIVNNNQSGNIQLSYFQKPPNNTIIAGALATFAIPQTTLMNMPYLQQGNAYTSYRSIRVPSDSDDDVLVPNNSGAITSDFTEGWYLLFTGFPTTSGLGIAKIDCYFNGEFTPVSSSAPFCAQADAQAGAMTDEVIATTLRQFPILQSLTATDAEHLTCKMDNTTCCKYASARQYVSMALSGIKPRNKVPMVAYNNNGPPGMFQQPPQNEISFEYS
jgi:hypothetical protein